RGTTATVTALRALAQANPHLRCRVYPIKLHGLSEAFRSMHINAKHRDGGPRVKLDREMYLVSLRLDHAKIFPQSVKLIAQAVEPHRLERLSISHTGLTDQDLA